MEEPRPNEAPDSASQAEMSEISTVFGIFFEPGRVFESLKRKPRFIIGGIIVALLITAYSFGIYYKVGEKAIRQVIVTELDKNPQVSAMPADQKNGVIEMQMTIQRVLRYAIPVVVFISFFLGGLFYFLGAKAFGGNGGYMQAVSVWIYSSIPPTIVSMLANFIVLALKSSDEIDLIASQRGVVHANPSMFLDGRAQPVLSSILSTFDLFAIWGWVLAAIGIRITNKMSSGSAWAIVIIFALIGVLFRVVSSFFSGNPT